MRLSKCFFRTFKEAPHEADIVSHQLLERGGFLKKLGKGLYIYTPLMWRVIQKIITIIREEHERSGCQEVSLPILNPKEPWDTSGRWDDYTSEKLLYTLEDREGHPFCIAPTHEEVMAGLVHNWATSYKDLPFILYQIGSKFRDEIRPRFGLMRCKEFLMKDAYSFAANRESMKEQYRTMRETYIRIFDRLGLDYVIVQAHGGKISRDESEEFQVKAAIGEDVVMVCGDYAANVEATVAIPPPFTYDANPKEKERLSTPDITTIDALAAFTKLPPQQILKTVLYKLIYSDREECVAIGIRGERQVNDVKVATHFGAIEIVLLAGDEAEKFTKAPPGFLGPLNNPFPFYADKTAEPMTNFVCAANEKDVHYINVNWDRDCKRPEFHDFLLAEEGDKCPHVPNGTYHVQRGVEVGHIFNIGTKYTDKMQIHFQDENGKTQPYWMGSYGIGVGRTAAACVEQRHDERGMIWPLSIAPYRVLITAAISNNEAQVALAEEIYNEFQSQGYEPLLDDRKERIGFKLRDSDLIGIPYKIIIGKAYESEGKIEVESRAGEKSLLSRDALPSWAKEHLSL